MKRYIRKTALIKPSKLILAALYAAIASAAILIFAGAENAWFIICSAIAFSLLVIYLFVIIAVGGRYRYLDSHIEISYLSLAYKKLNYSLFNCIVISNASYNNGLGYGINGNVPMQYKVKGKNGNIKVTFPFITLHQSQEHINKIKSNMNSRDFLFALNSDEVYFLGICWFDSLKELLTHIGCNVYVLEDVYLRYKQKFDDVFSDFKTDIYRFYIITDHAIAYNAYLEDNV